MTNIFETKEEYLKLRNFWKEFHAEKKHLPVEHPIRRYDFDLKAGVTDGYYMESPLNVRHHMVYLVATSHNLDKAFEHMSFETVNRLLNEYMRNGLNPTNLWFIDRWFALFGDAIDVKYQNEILKRIREYLETKCSKFGQ